METAKTKVDERTIVNTKALAKMFNMTERNVRNLVAEDIIGRVGHGRYDLIDSVSRYITFLKMASDGLDDATVEESLEYEKWLHEKAKREKAEIELAHIKKEMHKSDEVEKVLNHMVMAFRSKMLSLPSKVALQLTTMNDANQIEDLLERDVHQALKELSEYDPSMFFAEDIDMEEIEIVGEGDGTETNDASIE
ncbi:hypothetical protein MHH70_12475 [Metasolibacillus sp. FSL H7-0170]|uniref:hypothetical protein n=1 Tax=Metasolibacillus sp. FSL H7-0170 TaxID=2921431 RepID=UPI0031594536